MLYFFLIPSTIILGLVGYLVYSDYKSNILFRGESFRESKLTKKLVDFFMPSKAKADKIDSDLFYLTHTKTIRDFTMLKIVVLFISIVLSSAIVYTNYLNNRANVFLKERAIPVKISESDYNVLINRLSFEYIDYQTDLNKLNSNISKTQRISDYISVDIQELYSTVKAMRNELDDAFGFGSIMTFFAIIVFMWYSPNMILKLLDRMLSRDLYYEYSRLESYIYMNAEKPIDQIIRGLSYESIIFRAPFMEFLARYREDSEYAYELILSTRGANLKFKRLIEYLKLLDNTSPQKAREKISVHQANNLKIVEKMYLHSIEKKKSLCKGMIYSAIFLNLIVIAIGIATSINFSSLTGY